MNKQICTICSNKDSKWDLCKNGYDIYKCNHCNHFFVHPMPTDNELENIYSSVEGYHSNKDAEFPNNYHFNELFYDQVDKISQYMKKGLILDVGCSNGEFLALARKNGYHVHGVELNKSTASIALNNGIPVSVNTLEKSCFPENNFDVVRLGDIIEHVTDVKGFIKEVHRILKPGGIVLINTPNHDAFFPKTTYFLFKTFGIPWSHPTPPHHLNQFSPKSVGFLLAENKFNIKEMYYSGCSLKYEIGVTFVITNLKTTIKNKSYKLLPKQFFAALAVGVSYPIIWFVDRLLFLKKHDFNMSVIAEK